MSLFVWKGSETELSCACCVQNLAVEILEDKFEDSVKYAKGTITIIDYIEHGITFTEPWEAQGVLLKDKTYHWKVSRIDGPDVFFRYPDSGDPAFTCNDDLNEAIKIFICSKLRNFVAGVVEPEILEYSGPIERYSGPCACDEIISSSDANPFPWQEKTQGRFPNGCFECSCGKKWWNLYGTNIQWIEVGDDKAWELLLKYNGVETKKLGILEDKIYLMQTIRDKGYIPIG